MAHQLHAITSAVIERAGVHDMMYPACPRCQASLQSALQQLSSDRRGVVCAACETATARHAVPFRYRLKLQVLFGSTVCDAMLFDEPAESLLGVSASRLRKLQSEYPSLLDVMEDLLLGLRVSFTYRSPESRASSAKYNRDLKILSIQPLTPSLLPRPLARLALAYLSGQHEPHQDD
ncbi:hypothetical protein ATCC90586_003097 [Pythium insidiosum]|nr:hypothetical protein ATCC90586_003097 [Pythium insidiosum]